VTKKHFIAVAAAIARVRKDLDCEPGAVDACNAITDELASVFKSINSNFDRGRFTAACEAEVK